MKIEAILGLVMAEIDRAEKLHPVWPADLVKAAAIPAEVQSLLDQRAAARQAKNWAESDRLRDAIAALGWAVKDTKDGQRLSKS